jgi:DNA-binding winged helix-turn-helix (wHTH) protein/TolB-like protein/Flp pilus assembly protein TadD
MSVANNHFYQFDSFRLNPTQQILERNGEIVPLSPKVLEILLVLVENSGQVVAKDELIKRVWADTFVEETNLTKNISILRKVLSENNSGSSFIETIPKRGYRFIAPVRVFEEESSKHAAVSHKSNFPISGKKKIGFAAIVISLVLLIGFALRYYGNKSNNPVGVGQIDSIAVLPLRTLDAGENYLGLGIADAVIRRLSQTGKLTVRPTSAVRRYLNEETDALTAGRDLNAEVVLDGNVQRDGDRLRVSINLLRVSDGVSLWADSFDMRTADIFTVQDRVAQQVASRLRLQLDPARQAGLKKRSTSNQTAYEYYVKGVYSADQRGFGIEAKPQMEATIALFKKAIEVDPDFALAHAHLANAYIWTALFIEEQDVWAERAKEEIDRADALDPQLAETHVARHWLLCSAYGAFQSEAAVRELLLAQKLDPNVGHVELGSIYYHLGLEELGDRAYQRALEIDPTSEYVKYMTYAHYYLVRKYDEWLATYQKFNPNDDVPLPLMYLIAKGRLDEAQKRLNEISVPPPNAPGLARPKAFLSALKGDFRTAEAQVPATLSIANSKHFAYHHITYDVACIYALTGKSNEAVKWLRKTAAAGFPSYTLFERDPYLQRIRQEPEFVKFMTEMKEQMKDTEASLIRYKDDINATYPLQ